MGAPPPASYGLLVLTLGLIGPQSERKADRLLTRDRGFSETYFRRLTILDPRGAEPG